jgi:DNA-binding GntR family transcriptional regulator
MRTTARGKHEKAETAEFSLDETQPFELITAVDVAYKGIRSSILSGEFEPGMQLKLQHLGNRYSISLIPVREALRVLEAEGLVQTVRNKGARVAPLSMDEALDVYRLRLVLESVALKMAFEHVDDELVRTLQQYQREMREVFSSDRIKYLAIHQKLHFSIYSRCGSKWTLRMLALLWSHSERWRRLSLPRLSLQAPTEDHTAIISALRRRDLRAAGKALEHHIQVSVESLESTISATHLQERAADGSLTAVSGALRRARPKARA